MIISNPGRSVATAAAFGLLVGGISTVSVSPASAATICSSHVPGDVNGDGYAEVAVGLPEKHSDRGGVQIFYGTPAGLALDATGTALDDQYFSQDTPGVPGVPDGGDQFGGSTAFSDLNTDGCADLVVGAPGDGRSGSITIFYGGPAGLTTTGLQRIKPVDLVGTAAFLDFGRSLAVGDLDGDGSPDLAVGIPYLQVDGTETGGVAVYFGSATGPSPTRAPVVVTPASPGVPGDVNGSGEFGFALAAGDFDGDGRDELAVGVPEESRSGAVQVLQFGPDGLDGTQPPPISQETPGVPGENDDPDDFGAVLAIGDTDADGHDDLAIGAPRYSITSDVEQSGGVFLILGSDGGLTGAGAQVWTAASPGVPGETDFMFGRSVAMGRLDAGPTDDLAIGDTNAPVGKHHYNVGAVTVLFGGSGGISAAGAELFNQDVEGIPGAAEDSDEFGKAVAAAYVQGAAQASLVIGAPGERIGRTSSGMVHQLVTGPDGPQAVGSRAFHPSTAGVKGTAKSAGFGRTLNGPLGRYE